MKKKNVEYDKERESFQIGERMKGGERFSSVFGNLFL